MSHCSSNKSSGINDELPLCDLKTGSAIVAMCFGLSRNICLISNIHICIIRFHRKMESDFVDAVVSF